MKIPYIFLGIFALTLCLFACQNTDTPITDSAHHIPQSGAAQSMDYWSYARSYPDGKIQTGKWAKAVEAKQAANLFRTTDDADWTGIGPKNIGGRILCLGFHPDDENTIFAGSASGGLWKTTTDGVGYTAWERVAIDYPVLGVPAIVINPQNPNEMYIGTGEVYNNTGTMPGVVDRFTRGSYGIGILKTMDGGETWTKSLDWSYNDLTGVQYMAINPLNPSTVFAATTEGLYRTQNAGATWELIYEADMIAYVQLMPNDTSTVFMTVGSYYNPNSGLYRSQDGGDNFAILGNGAPQNYSGKARLSFHTDNPNIIYCSASDATDVGSFGLYKSSDGGESWSLNNTTDVPKYQGWYAHDIAVKGDEEDIVIWTGVDVYKSNNSGNSLTQTGYWSNWDFGQVPVGGPEGPSNYVHADIHAAYFHPQNPNKLYLATDGGLFVSDDAGDNFEGRNGSLQTQQFYANFANSTTDPNFAIGGMQDNATAIYVGDDAWIRVIGGDGMCAAINPDNDDIVYGSYQRLGMRRSTNHGNNFNNIAPNEAFDEDRAFNGPFELAPSNPDKVYAGAQHVFVSENGGDDWEATSINFVDGNNIVFNIGVSPQNEDHILVATATSPYVGNPQPPKVFKSTIGGVAWEFTTGLPDRLCMDLAIHPTDENIAYAVFSGFGTDHVYQSQDGGSSWASIDNGLPDVPTNSILIDPDFPDQIYVANDLGVYVSLDAGANWETFMTGLPTAILAMHLSVSESDRQLRVATHGNGIWQSPLLDEFNATKAPNTIFANDINIYPNPASDVATIEFELKQKATLDMAIYDVQGRLLKAFLQAEYLNGTQRKTLEISDLPSGTYVVRLGSESVPLVVQ